MRFYPSKTPFSALFWVQNPQIFRPPAGFCKGSPLCKLFEYLRIPPLRKYLGHLRGGILREGGIVNWNTPDIVETINFGEFCRMQKSSEISNKNIQNSKKSSLLLISLTQPIFDFQKFRRASRGIFAECNFH